MSSLSYRAYGEKGQIMNAKEAFVLACRDPEFLHYAKNVLDCIPLGLQSNCMIYAIGHETFYFGFDGVDLQSGKHSAVRSKELLARNAALVIAAGKEGC